MSNKQRSLALSWGTMLVVGVFAPPSFGQWVAYGPGPRDQHTAVYDSATAQMIVFGGTDLGTTNYNDVWLAVNLLGSGCSSTCGLQWNFETLTGPAPAPRSGHSAVYDSANSRMIVFGGALGFPAPCSNDVWVLENANGSGGAPLWAELTPGGTPPPARTGQAAAYDPTTNVMVIFGGSDCDGGYLSDVWVLNNANGLGSGIRKWKRLAPPGNIPPARAFSAAAYNSGTNSLLVYGGTNGTQLGDTWLLAGANGTKKTSSWSQLSPEGTAPAPRYGAACGYDAANDRLIVNSGYSTEGILGDTWVLENATGAGGAPAWTSLTTSHAGAPIYFHSGVYDPASNQFVVFAGISSRSRDPTQADDHMFYLTDANGEQVLGRSVSPP
jgi:hypothetical protein